MCDVQTLQAEFEFKPSSLCQYQKISKYAKGFFFLYITD